ncbi:hypothetical protein G3N56_10220 [Desulfovibrio sulfodismutans]|uniref:Uncharacterized protein n=1 Tax=Desulfolutivibrio sulfodismutans TaxID=63561 RepID=A0A7K3NMW4_9BACT|nr:hypothetical protein [Desulfolutivibrio sulfodismutans]NDY57115.1 hypothetical protein [Desulfolutivibrio sulfodismutans]QLA12663.1 hypothetical protein GD606_10450 [Desulfolutivibrio sulfodismutans DSM 3696]
MAMHSMHAGNVQVADVRTILSEDFSATTTNRVIMAIKTSLPDVSIIALSDLRTLLADDFSEEKINRVMMSLKCFCLKAYQ